MNWMNLLVLVYEFFKTGLFAVGGGLATIPFLKEMADTYGWFTDEMLSTMVAISESTPGPIGINMATYVGYLQSGVIGGVLATLGLIAPSIIIICIIANYFQKFKEAKIVRQIFAGLKPAVIGFIAAACLDIFIGALFHVDALQTGHYLSFFNIKSILLLAIMLGINKKYPKFHPIAFIALGAIAGILLKL